MEPKHQVFISSTHNDLIEERKAVIEELLNLGCIPAAMEFFQPIDKSLKIIKGFLDNCDYVVLIVAGRYGSVIKRKRNKVSFTEEEYNYAKRNKIPVIPFLLEEKSLSKLKKSRKNTDQEKVEKTINGQNRLTRFRRRLMKEQLIKFYETKKDLPELVANALNEAKTKRPRPGWARAYQASNWNIIYSASEKNFLDQKQYEDIRPLFRNERGMSTKLKLAFPLTKRLVGKNKREVKRLLQQPRNATIIRNAVASRIYNKNSDTKILKLDPKWIDYEVVYAMCHVSENHLINSSKGFVEYSFSNMNWWKPPWDNIILYISQICSDQGFVHAVKGLLRDAIDQEDQKIRAECLGLIYRMIMFRSSVKTDLLNRVIREILSISPNKQDTL